MHEKPNYKLTEADLERIKLMHFQGYKQIEIAKKFKVTPTAINQIIQKKGWDKASAINKSITAAALRYSLLISENEKNGKNIKEVEVVLKHIERLAKLEKYLAGDLKEKDLNPNLSKRGNKKNGVKNDCELMPVEEFSRFMQEHFFKYQFELFEAGKKSRIRQILKSRQIGLTYYFAFEALFDAVTTGRNQIFLSASKPQSEVFLHYIRGFSKDIFDLELKGNPIELSNGAVLRFLSTNSRTAQSYTGNLYVDEYFWIPKFDQLKKVAAAMASHKKWRTTYFSTPSSMSHDAYKFWIGDWLNKGKKESEKIKIDVTPPALADGRICQDKIYRQVITLDHAIAKGCDLFEIDGLKYEYSDYEFKNLFECQFIDDTQGVFGMSLLEPCFADSKNWADVDFDMSRPVGNRPVWLGIDPARSRDDSTIIVLLPPQTKTGKFKVLEKVHLKNISYNEQGERIKFLAKKYNVEYIGLDCTGVGSAIYDEISSLGIYIQKIFYSPEIKSRMVITLLSILRAKILEFDKFMSDIARALLMIKPATTPTGIMTYISDRSEGVGHADIAWALMHALFNYVQVEKSGSGGVVILG